MKKTQILVLGALTLISIAAKAQDINLDEPQKDSITLMREQIEGNSSSIKGLQKLKVSGYIQTEMEVGQQNAELKTGANSGKYSQAIDGDHTNFLRYGIRRGRIKFQYTQGIANGVFELDINEGGIKPKNAYLQVTDPYVEMFSLKAGLFDVCFGDEVAYSSSALESPERSLVIQKLFPDEKDLGGVLTIAAQKNTTFDGLKLDLGLVSGSTISKDDNGRLNFVSHLKYDKAFSTMSYGLGASFYSGSTNNSDTMLYTVKDGAWVSQKTQANQTNKPQYFGLDGQFSFETAMGMTSLRAEYISGQQPSVAGDLKSPVGNTYTDKFNYKRKFQGGYLYFIQDIYHTPLTFVLKYSWLDNNTELKGDQITNKADLALSTIGVGCYWRINSALRLTAFYDINTNEKTAAIAKYSRDVLDNVFTLRLQYKF
jgi:Phosphate-selective porin